MALTRRPRSGSLVQPEIEPTQETALDQQILVQLQGLTKSQDELKGQLRDLRTVLMGDGVRGETPYGRVPSLTADVEQLKRDVITLREARVSATAYWNLTRIIGHALTGLGGGLVGALAARFLGGVVIR